MTTDLSIREYAPHELDDLRSYALTLPWGVQQKFTSLIEAFEERAELEAKIDAAHEKLETLAEELTDALEPRRKSEKPEEKLERLESKIKATSLDLTELAGDLA